jgi:hypothetical protein
MRQVGCDVKRFVWFGNAAGQGLPTSNSVESVVENKEKQIELSFQPQFTLLGAS